MPWRQQRLAGAKAAWGVLWSSDQDLECSENSDPDVSGHYTEERMYPHSLGCGQNRSCCDSVGVLVHKHLQTFLHSNFSPMDLLLLLLLHIIILLLPLEQPGVLRVSEHVLVVEGAADAGVGGHGLEQLGAVHLLAVQHTPLQKVLGPGSLAWRLSV